MCLIIFTRTSTIFTVTNPTLQECIQTFYITVLQQSMFNVLMYLKVKQKLLKYLFDIVLSI